MDGGDAELGLKHSLQTYLTCVTFVKWLKNSKFKDNAIVVLISDHGWQMREKGYLFKNSQWEESPRIPFIIVDPNSKSGGEVDHLC